MVSTVAVDEVLPRKPEDPLNVAEMLREPSSVPGKVTGAWACPEALTTMPEGELTQRWPQVLPGGRAVLYTGHYAIGAFDNAYLAVQPL